eukprot:jgi/Tetstr1/443702/TSEL_031692.t1
MALSQSFQRRVPLGDGTQMAVHDFGGLGPPLILLHGTGLHGLVFTPMARSLRSRFRCLAPDLRGHGDSAAAAAVLSFDAATAVQDVVRLIEHLELDRCMVFGHSHGGMLALYLAETCQRVEAVYCFDPIVSSPETYSSLARIGVGLAQRASREARDGQQPHRTLCRGQPASQLLRSPVGCRRRRQFASAAEAARELGRKFPYSDFTDEALQLFVAHAFRLSPDGEGVVLKCDPDIEAFIYVDIGKHARSIWQGISAIRCRVVVSCAGHAQAPHDALQRAAAELAEELRQRSHGACSFHRHEGLHHFGPFTAPARIAEHVESMLLPTDPSTSREMRSRL